MTIDSTSPQLLTSSPLDRLDRLARMELKKTGWFERACVPLPPGCLTLNCFDVATSGVSWSWVCKGCLCRQRLSRRHRRRGVSELASTFHRPKRRHRMVRSTPHAPREHPVGETPRNATDSKVTRSNPARQCILKTVIPIWPTFRRCVMPTRRGYRTRCLGALARLCILRGRNNKRGDGWDRLCVTL